jgi:lipid II isoglutaminyl synthase (glutamine-hydrolysing)
MKKIHLLLLLLLVSFQLRSQRMDNDIFGDPQYESRDLSYKANLKKDIFDNLIFTDNNKNELKFEKKYLDAFYPNILTNGEAKFDFFRHLVSTYRQDAGYKATYSIDIFDAVIIKDNRDYELKMGKDIFGNATYEEKGNGDQFSIRKNLLGELEYKSNRLNAKLKKDILNRWEYSDDSGNTFEFGEATWNMLKHRFGTDEDILMYLIRELVQQSGRTHPKR